jgi:tRNA(fMet)-specific endonuclease VapC
LNLCLDTNVFIELMRGRRLHFRKRLEEASDAGASFHLSPIVLHELTFGALRSLQREERLLDIDHATTSMQPHDWTAEDAMECAQIRADLASGGVLIGVYDLMLAGQARRRDWTLVTGNLREFARVDGLKLIDWSDPDGPRELTGGVAHFLQRLKRD